MPTGATEGRDLGGGGLGVRIMGIAVLLLLFLSAFGVWALQSNLRTGRSEARAGVLRNTRVTTALASSVAGTATSQLAAMATVPAFVDGDIAGGRAYISASSPGAFLFTDLFWVGLDGTTISAKSDPDGGTPVADRPYFQEASAGKRYVSAGLRGKSTGAYILVFAVPTYDRSFPPKVNGVLAATVDLSFITAESLKQLFGSDTISVYDRERKLIFGADPERLGRPMSPELVAALDRKDEGVLPTGTPGPSSREGQVVSYGSAENAGWTVVVETDASSLMKTIEHQYERSVALLVALGAVAFLVAAFGAWRLDAAHRRVVEARARLAAMIDQLPAGVVLVDGGGTISMANRTAIDSLEAMAGTTVEVGRSAPPELVESIEVGNGRTGDPGSEPATDIQVERGGAVRSFSVRSTPVRTRRGVSGAVALVEETTARRAEERRRTAMADLVAALSVADNTPQIGRTLSSRAAAALGCDECALVMLDPETGAFDVVSEPLGREWFELLRPDVDDDESPLVRAVRQHRTIEVAGPTVRTIVLPLQSAGRGVGALALGFDPSSDVDLAAVNGFAAQVALSVDRARRREIEHDVSLTLQRTLLAAAPADADRLSVALRYRPSSDQMLVGGDFYDVINLSDGSTLLVIGDVVGHGLEAATTMGQLKIAIRAFALESASPASIMTKLDEFVSSQLEAARYTTAVLALVDADVSTVRYAVAGHPPPLLCPPGGVVVRMATPGEALLGLPPRGGRTELVVDLAPGATAICLYTDGLIERPDLPLDEGIARLSDAIDAGDPAEIDVTAERIMELVDGLPRRDDVALLYAVVRR